MMFCLNLQLLNFTFKLESQKNCKQTILISYVCQLHRFCTGPLSPSIDLSLCHERFLQGLCWLIERGYFREVFKRRKICVSIKLYLYRFLLKIAIAGFVQQFEFYRLNNARTKYIKSLFCINRFSFDTSVLPNMIPVHWYLTI